MQPRKKAKSNPIRASKQEVFTEAEAAKFLRFSRKHLQNMRCAGAGPIYSKPGRSIRYLRSDLMVWLNDSRRGGAGS